MTYISESPPPTGTPVTRTLPAPLVFRFGSTDHDGVDRGDVGPDAATPPVPPVPPIPEPRTPRVAHRPAPARRPGRDRPTTAPAAVEPEPELPDVPEYRELVTAHVGGEERDWTLPALTESATAVRVTGRLIGASSTFRRPHVCGYPDRHADRTERCGSCRWFETRVFRLTGPESRYVIFNVGRSVVPGEVNYSRITFAHSPNDLIEAYVVRRENERPFLTKPGQLVLAQAAAFDPALVDAYRRRSARSA